MKFTRAIAAVIVVVGLLGAACGSEASGNNASDSESATDPSADDSASSSGVDACTFPNDNCDFREFLCQDASLGTRGCGAEELFGEGHKCVISALRNAMPGAVRIDLVNGNPQNEPLCGYDDIIIVLGDGTAILDRVGPGGSPKIIERRRVEVRPPEFFDPCVDSDDYATVRDCVTDWFIPDSCVPGVCCPGPNEAGHPLCE